MRELQHIIAQLDQFLDQLLSLELWPPWEAAQTIVDIVAAIVNVVVNPPEPEPKVLEDAAAAWRSAASRVDTAALDVARTTTTTTTTVWEGEAGDAYRSSLEAFTHHLESMPNATGGVSRALVRAADAIADARQRHGDAQDRLTRHLTITWSDLAPWELSWKLRDIVTDVIEAVRGLAGAYRDALAAVHDFDVAAQSALDLVTLPDHVTPGMAAIEQVNVAGGDGPGSGPAGFGGFGDDRGPLRPGVAERADASLAGMSVHERAAVQELLDGATGASRRAWIVAAVAAGMSGASLRRYAAQLMQIPDERLEFMSPSAFPEGVLVQPDGTTCGSSSLVTSRMINDPAYAMYLITGFDPNDAAATPVALDPEDPAWADEVKQRFGAEALQMHDRTNTWYPEPLGTYPQDAANQMNAASQGSGVPGSTYDVEVVDPMNPDQMYYEMYRAAADGHTVPVYAYDVGASGSGAHVTLVVGTQGEDLIVYDPSRGELKTLTRSDWNSESTKTALGWSKPMSVIVPTT